MQKIWKKTSTAQISHLKTQVQHIILYTKAHNIVLKDIVKTQIT